MHADMWLTSLLHHSQGPPFPRSGIGVRVRVKVRLRVSVRVRRTVGMADPGNGGPESLLHTPYTVAVLLSTSFAKILHTNL